MLRKANNVFSVLLNDGTITTGTVDTSCPVGTVVTPANLPSGAIVVTNLGLQRLDAAGFTALSNGDQYFVVQGRGTTKSLMKSPVITVGNTKFSISRHKNAVQQMSVIGYNGTNGALPIANDTSFFIKIRKRDNDAANRSQPFSLFAGPVRTDATGTQAELASMLVRNGYLNFKDEPANHYLKFEAICDAAGAVPTLTSTFAAVYGSRTVTVDVLPGNVAVNDYIRLEGTGVTSPVYKVVSISGLSLVLNSPFTGTTATYAVANTRRITAVLAAAANFGVSLTGIAAPFDVNQFRDYYANRFTATFSDTSTLVSHMVGAFNGNGTWQQVAMDEYMSYGFEGEMQQTSTPAISRDQFVKIPGIGTNTVLSSRYSCLDISWEESISGLVSRDGGKGNVLIYLNLDSTSPLGLLDTAVANNGETFVIDLGLTAADFDMV